jgi:hypothetical protein
MKTSAKITVAICVIITCLSLTFGIYQMNRANQLEKNRDIALELAERNRTEAQIAIKAANETKEQVAKEQD